MKKLLLLSLLFFSNAANAQKDVTKFLGIPVDGTKTEMTEKLKNKGFTYNSKEDFFSGEFNGSDVHLYVVTNNRKVWRIMICDVNTCGEADIKVRFNNLCRQFSKNGKYISAKMGDNDYIIPGNEDISYEMLVNNKRYEASYFQTLDPEMTDTLAVQKKIKEVLLQKYTQEEIDNPSDEQREEIQSIAIKEGLDMAFDMVEMKSVWFLIREHYGKYYIALFYDNMYNKADGEDL